MTLPGQFDICQNYDSFHAETDRAVDPVVAETRPPKTKQVKKTKVDAKTREDVSNLPTVSHPSHGSTPGQVGHMTISLNYD